MNHIKLKYFEDGSSWMERSSLAATTATTGTVSVTAAKSISVSIIDFCGVFFSAVDLEGLSDILTVSSSTFVFIHNATTTIRQHMMQLSYVRKMYGITDLVRYEPRENSDKGTVALVRVGVNCEVVENATKVLDGGIARLFMLIQVRSFFGASLSLAALYVDPSTLPRQRLTLFASVLQRLGSAELTVLCANLFAGQTSALRSDITAGICAACAGRGFVDAADEAGERNSGNSNAGANSNSNSSGGGSCGLQAEWSAWVKSSKYTVTYFSREAPQTSAAGSSTAAGGKMLPVATTITFGPRTAATIAIPQPRSAKSVNSRGSPASVVVPAIITDPAILSAEAAEKNIPITTKSVSSGILERLLQQQQQQQQAVQRWRMSNSYTLKSNEKLNSQESPFDISPHFSSVAEAVDALNSKAIYWPADFCVVHNVILASDSIGQCDKRMAFRRYARDYKNSASLLSQIFHHWGLNNSAKTDGLSQAVTQEKSQWLKRSVAVSNHSGNEANGGDDSASLLPASRAARREEELRNRSWDASWCTVVYQVTPREMKFNITPAVGVGKDSLNKAIQCLNLRSQSNLKFAFGKENPLQNYAYDYALLFSTELQGYWLIAATHVPCDIVACRSAA